MPSASKSYLVALNVLGFAAADIFSSTYVLDTVYEGADFFDGFNFQTTADLSHGFVNYVGQSEAQSLGLISTSSALGVYMGVDYSTTLSCNGVGRNSVRITSKKSFTHGLIISDITHMPGGICGTWPAHWTLGPNWPNTGEINIIEGANSQTDDLMSLHTNESCSIAGDTRYQTGTAQSLDCDVYSSANVGCGISSSSAVSYGSSFNSVSGGVYATQWTSDYIRIWFFPRSSIPTDIQSETPDPSLWGLPQANFQGDCDIDEHFQDHQIIFDTNFCGDLAANTWTKDAVCSPKASTCVDYVAGNPAVFKDAYWAVNSVKVYQLEESSASTSAVSPEPNSLTSVIGASSILDIGMGVSTAESATPTTSVAFPIQATSSGIDPYVIDNFFYLGCVGSLSGFPTFHQVSESALMTPELCVSQCGNFVYAGVYSNQCFCADELDAETGIGSGKGICDIACPGSATEVCGGLASASANNSTTRNYTLSSRVARRQTGALSSSILFTTYENIVEVAVDGIGSAISSVLGEFPAASSTTSIDTSQPRITITLGPGPNYSKFLSALATASPSASDGVHYVPPSGSTSSPALTTVVPASSLVGVGMGGAFSQVIEVVTTYVDVCSTGLTTITTTSTITQCSCLSHLSSIVPSIPMTTTVKACPVCGPAGKPTSVTVTIPQMADSGIYIHAAATAKAVPYPISNAISYACPGSPNCPANATRIYAAPVLPTEVQEAAIFATTSVPSAVHQGPSSTTILAAAPKIVIIYSSITVIPLPYPTSVPVSNDVENGNSTVKLGMRPMAYTGAASGGRIEGLEKGLVVAFVVILGVGWMIL